MLEIPFAQVGAGKDSHNAHFTHIASNGILVDTISFPIHDRSDFPVAQERVLRIQFINPVFEANFLRRGRNRLVVKAGAIQA